MERSRSRTFNERDYTPMLPKKDNARLVHSTRQRQSYRHVRPPTITRNESLVNGMTQTRTPQSKPEQRQPQPQNPVHLESTEGRAQRSHSGQKPIQVDRAYTRAVKDLSPPGPVQPSARIPEPPNNKSQHPLQRSVTKRSSSITSHEPRIRRVTRTYYCYSDEPKEPKVHVSGSQPQPAKCPPYPPSRTRSVYRADSTSVAADGHHQQHLQDWYAPSRDHGKDLNLTSMLRPPQLSNSSSTRATPLPTTWDETEDPLMPASGATVTGKAALTWKRKSWSVVCRTYA